MRPAQVRRSVAYRRPTRVVGAFLGIWNDQVPAGALPRIEFSSFKFDDTCAGDAILRVSYT